MRLRLVFVLCLAAALAGCTTLTPEERRALDEEECRSYGFRPGTDAFAECLQRIELDRRAEMRARRASLDDWPGPHVVYRPIIIREDD